MDNRLRRFIPDLRARVDVELVGSPLTHERFLRRHRGTYGPELSAADSAFPGARTAVDGLLTCGDSCWPGIGVPAVAGSGIAAAHAVRPARARSASSCARCASGARCCRRQRAARGVGTGRIKPLYEILLTTFAIRPAEMC